MVFEPSFKTLKDVLIIQITKNHHHFNFLKYDYSIKKENLPNKLFRKHNGHPKWCLESDFGVKHSFYVPQP
jgi:hypothetical protein